MIEKPDYVRAFERIRKTCEAWTAEEGTEWVEGAERPLVPTTRSEEGPGVAEQRSAEGRAVPPVKAKAALLWALDALGGHAAECCGHSTWVALEGTLEEAQEMESTAAELEDIMWTLIALLPEPESDADAPVAHPNHHQPEA